MFHIVLFEPQIPPNTGNIIRLCANTGTQLHLIQPLGFDLNEKSLRRAGMDYSELLKVNQYQSLDDFYQGVNPGRVSAISTKGKINYAELYYQSGDAFLFGPETRGLPEAILSSSATSAVLRIPMQADSRSLNLSNAVAVIAYEAWRQQGFLSSLAGI